MIFGFEAEIAITPQKSKPVRFKVPVETQTMIFSKFDSNFGAQWRSGPCPPLEKSFGLVLVELRNRSKPSQRRRTRMVDMDVCFGLSGPYCQPPSAVVK